MGYLDAVRILDDSNSIFTQWDYRDRAWEENNGVRIDHILLSPNAADKLEDSWIDYTLRSQAKPSDHVPVWVSLGEKWINLCNYKSNQAFWKKNLETDLWYIAIEEKKSFLNLSVLYDRLSHYT